MKIQLEQIKPFGPTILKVKIPEKIIDDLNHTLIKLSVIKKNQKN